MASLSTYSSTKTVDYEKSIILSFDIKKSAFGVGHEKGKFVYNDSEKLSSYKGLNLSGNILSNNLNQKTFLEDNLFVDINYLLTTNKNEISVIKNNINTPMFYVSNGIFYIDSSKNKELNTGKEVYEIISSIDEASEEVIESGDEVYKKSEKYTCDDYLIVGGTNGNYYPIQLEMDKSSIAVLSAGEIIKRDISKYPIYSISHTSNGVQTDFYYENPLFEKNTERFRFVFSNRGKILTISSFDDEKNCFVQKETFYFNLSENSLPKKVNVYTSSSSNISNVSANF